MIDKENFAKGTMIGEHSIRFDRRPNISQLNAIRPYFRWNKYSEMWERRNIIPMSNEEIRDVIEAITPNK